MIEHDQGAPQAPPAADEFVTLVDLGTGDEIHAQWEVQTIPAPGPGMPSSMAVFLALQPLTGGAATRVDAYDQAALEKLRRRFPDLSRLGDPPKPQ